MKNKEMTAKEFAKIWYANYPDDEAEEFENRIRGLASEIEKYFIPRKAKQSKNRLYRFGSNKTE